MSQSLRAAVLRSDLGAVNELLAAGAQLGDAEPALSAALLTKAVCGGDAPLVARLVAAPPTALELYSTLLVAVVSFNCNSYGDCAPVAAGLCALARAWRHADGAARALLRRPAGHELAHMVEALTTVFDMWRATCPTADCVSRVAAALLLPPGSAVLDLSALSAKNAPQPSFDGDGSIFSVFKPQRLEAKSAEAARAMARVFAETSIKLQAHDVDANSDNVLWQESVAVERQRVVETSIGLASADLPVLIVCSVIECVSQLRRRSPFLPPLALMWDIAKCAKDSAETERRRTSE